VQGFLSGNKPRQPAVDEEDGPEMDAWRGRADQYFATGSWPPDD
jgi:hypothetical protein